MKLSKAQCALLEDVVRKGRETCLESYPPSRKLIEYGLVTAREGSFGQSYIEPTEAGRALILERARD